MLHQFARVCRVKNWTSVEILPYVGYSGVGVRHGKNERQLLDDAADLGFLLR